MLEMDNRSKLRLLMWLELIALHSASGLGLLYLWYLYCVSKRRNARRKSITDDPAQIAMMIGDWIETTKSQISEVSQKLMDTAPKDAKPPLAKRPRIYSSISDVCNLDDSAKRSRIYSAISDVCNLEMEDLITATRHFCHNKEDMDAFWGMPTEFRGKFVGMILRGKSQ